MRAPRLATLSGTAALVALLAGCPAGLPFAPPAADEGSFRVQARFDADRALAAVVTKYDLSTIDHVTYTLYKGVAAGSLTGHTAQAPLVVDTVVGPLGTAITSTDRTGAAIKDPVTFQHLRRGQTYTFTLVAYRLVRAGQYAAISATDKAYSFTVATDDQINFGQLNVDLQTPFDGKAPGTIAVTAGNALPAGVVTTENMVRPTSNPPPLDTPKGITTDGYVSDYARHTISRYSVESFDLVAGIPDTPGGGDNPDPLQATFTTPAGLFNTGSGLYVADNDLWKVRYVDFSGGVTTIAPAYNFYRPSAVTVDGAGVLYVANAGSGEVLKVDTSGNVSQVASGMGILTALQLVGTKLYVASVEYAAIYVIDLAASDPSQYTQLATCTNGPYGLAYDGTHHRLYFTEQSRVRYVDLNASGNPLLSYVGLATGTGFTDGFSRASFNNPTALCYENGKLHVCDTGNQTIRTVLDAAETSY